MPTGIRPRWRCTFRASGSPAFGAPRSCWARLGELGGTEVLITKGRAGLRADAAPVRPARSRRL